MKLVNTDIEYWFYRNIVAINTLIPYDRGNQKINVFIPYDRVNQKINVFTEIISRTV